MRASRFIRITAYGFIGFGVWVIITKRDIIMEPHMMFGLLVILFGMLSLNTASEVEREETGESEEVFEREFDTGN